MIQVHLRGMFLCTRFAIPYMVAQKSGKIINMTGHVRGDRRRRVHPSVRRQGRHDRLHQGARAGSRPRRDPSSTRSRRRSSAPTSTTTCRMRCAIPSWATYPLRRVGEVEDVVALRDVPRNPGLRLRHRPDPVSRRRRHHDLSGVPTTGECHDRRRADLYRAARHGSRLLRRLRHQQRPRDPDADPRESDRLFPTPRSEP